MISLLLAAQTSPSTVDELLKAPVLEGASYGLSITTLAGDPILQRNATLRLIPASNQKLISGAFALHTLGPDYRPSTRFWRTKAGLVIDSVGDPLLTFRTLKDLSTRLNLPRDTGVYLRQTYAPGVPGGWEYDDLPNRYAPSITALTVDRGGFELWNRNGRLVFVPDSFGVRMVRVAAPTFSVRYSPFDRRLLISGAPPKKTERVDTLAIPTPDRAVAEMFGTYFEDSPELPTTPPTAVIVGRPLHEALAECLPASDNAIAEHLLLMGGTAKSPHPVADPYGVSQAATTKFLTETVGIPASDFRVIDGSGLARQNLITARGVTQLLAWSARQPTFDLWRDRLAKPGRGTLRGRLDGIGFAGKTGTLSGVVGLSGYVTAANGETYIVSILLNNFTGSSARARAWADDVVRASRFLPMPTIPAVGSPAVAPDGSPPRR